MMTHSERNIAHRAPVERRLLAFCSWQENQRPDVSTFDFFDILTFSKHMGNKTNRSPHMQYARRLMTLIAMFVIIGSIQLSAQVYPLEYLDMAEENNPGLRAQRARHEAALEQSRISGALPDPELTAGISTPPMERLMGDHWFDVGVMQMFPWFGTLNKQRSAAETRAQALGHAYHEQRNQLYLNLTAHWLTIYEKDRQLQILQDYEETLKAREDIIYARYAGGGQQTSMTTDLYRLQIRLAEIRNRKNKIREEKTNLTRSFNVLVGRHEMTGVTIPDSLPEARLPEMPVAFSRSLVADNPTLLAGESDARAAETEKEADRLNTRPRLGVGLQYSYYAAGDAAMGQMDGGHMVMPMVSVSLPVFRNKNRATREQAEKLAEMEGFRKYNIINTLEIEWTQIKTNLNNLQRDHDFYLQQKELIRNTFELVMTAYASGDEGFEELLRLEEQLLDIQWRLLEVKVQHNTTMAELQKIKAENVFQR